MRLSATLIFSLALALTTSAKLSFKNGKAVVGDSASLSLNPTKKLTEVIKVNQEDIFKLTFTVFDDKSGKDVRPHQTFLRFWDESTKEEGIVPLKVTKDGKAKFNLNLKKPPSGLPPTSPNSILSVSLILGSFKHESSTFDMFNMIIPPSAPIQPHPESESFKSQPEIQHTFRPEQTLPAKPISLVFAIIVLSPWVVLLAFLTRLPVSFSPSSKTLPFIVLLAAFEGLLFWYWVGLYLGQVLAYGTVLGLLTAIAGKNALSS